MTKTTIRELGEAEKVADAAALSVMLDVPVGTLQRWAQHDGWPRRHSTTRRGRRTEYSIAAAKQSYECRRGSLDDPTSGEVTSGQIGDLSDDTEAP